MLNIFEDNAMDDSDHQNIQRTGRWQYTSGNKGIENNTIDIVIIINVINTALHLVSFSTLNNE